MARTSDIDADVPADNAKVDKADLRTNFGHAKDEIDQLFRETGLPWLLSIGTKSFTTL